MLFSIISCPLPLRHNKRFLPFFPRMIEKSTTLSLFGQKIQYVQLGRVKHLSAKKLCELCPSPVILSPNIPLKTRQRLEKNGMNLFSCKQYPEFMQILCLNSAIELLTLSGIPFPCQVLGIVDPAFHHPELAEFALRHLPQVHLFTENLSAAEQFAHRMMQEYGAPVLFSSKSHILLDCQLIFSPENQLVHHDIPCILPFPPDTVPEHTILFHSPVPILPPSLTGVTGTDIPAAEFLSSLYSLGRCSILKKTSCRQICRQNSDSGQLLLTPYDAAGLLLERFREGVLG